MYREANVIFAHLWPTSDVVVWRSYITLLSLIRRVCCSIVTASTHRTSTECTHKQHSGVLNSNSSLVRAQSSERLEKKKKKPDMRTSDLLLFRCLLRPVTCSMPVAKICMNILALLAYRTATTVFWYFIRACMPHTGLPIILPQAARVHLWGQL